MVRDLVQKEYRSIEEIYYDLYLEGMDTLKEQKKHERLLKTYLDRGFSQYDAMVNLVIADGRVCKNKKGMYEIRYNT